MSGAQVALIDESEVVFGCGRRYPVHRGAPIVLHPSSIFHSADVIAEKPTTQDERYRSASSLKNRLRQRALPSLGRSSSPGSAGYRKLATDRSAGVGLVIGSGDRIAQYRQDFATLDHVICSDVQTQFGADIVFDGHWIPMADGSIALALAAEVLEHTLRPWKVAAELERVTAADALIHIEVPFVFPLHGAPYDFFRFTVFGLRSLFPRSSVHDLRVAGGFSSAAVALADSMTNLAAQRIARQALMATGRFAFAGLKYLDRSPTANWRTASLPRSISLTLRRDDHERSDVEMIGEVSRWLSAPATRTWE